MSGTLNALLHRSLWKTVVLLGLLGILARPVSAQVGLPPIIAVQPLDTVVLNGGSGTLLVVATSLTGMSYKWYKDGTLIPGATAASYTLANVDATDEGGYHVEVRNTSGTTVSRTARVTVLLANDIPVAVNDSFTLPEDARLTVATPGVLQNDTDSYGGALTASLVTAPTNGTLSLNTDGSFVYLPQSNYHGADAFTYRALDGELKVLEENDTKLILKYFCH